MSVLRRQLKARRLNLGLKQHDMMLIPAEMADAVRAVLAGESAHLRSVRGAGSEGQGAIADDP